MSEELSGQLTEGCGTPGSQTEDGAREEFTKEDAKKAETKRVSDRINEIRQKEVEPLRDRISALEKEKEDFLKERHHQDALGMLERSGQLGYYRQNSDNELSFLRQRDFERRKQDVLSQLAQEFPDDNIRDIDHFDRRFYAMLSVGVDAPSAYRAVVQAQRKQSPPSSGSAGAQDGASDEYYSEDRVRAMSVNEVKKHYAGIIASMKKW